jgi:PIN domain nuclease of toxin-antitoxin system
VSFLLDTHVLLWYLADLPRLSGPVRAAIDEPTTRVLVSAAVAWEMRIKTALGKLTMPDNLEQALMQIGFESLAITTRHALAAGGLVRHHGDPFDRMLIAQAQLEGLIIVTHDALFRPYGVPILWT